MTAVQATIDSAPLAAPRAPSLQTYARAAGFLLVLSMIFGFLGEWYSIATFLRGYLIARSGYLPKFIGVLMMIAGAGFIAKNVTTVLAPAYSSDLFLAPMFFAGLPLMFWLLVKRVDIPT